MALWPLRLGFSPNPAVRPGRRAGEPRTLIVISISAGVGFIALFGVAVLNGVVMVSYLPYAL